MRSEHIVELAQVGAAVRLAEIQAECMHLERFLDGTTPSVRRTDDVSLRPGALDTD